MRFNTSVELEGVEKPCKVVPGVVYIEIFIFKPIVGASGRTPLPLDMVVHFLFGYDLDRPG